MPDSTTGVETTALFIFDTVKGSKIFQAQLKGKKFNRKNN
jgi:hypothetical protein